jgi:tetratricopeptide (TPR) repeat protein
MTLSSDSADPSAPEKPAGDRVPAWLAALVVVLLVAVVAVAAYLVGPRNGAGPAGGARDLAVEAAAAAVASHPGERTTLELASAYQQGGRFAQALSEYDAVLKLDSNNYAALYNEGLIYAAQGDKATAEARFRATLAISPSDVPAAEALGELLAAEGRYRDLIAVTSPAVKERPDMADLQCLVGLAREHLGEKAAAADAYRAALQYVPDMKEARDGLRRLGATP